MTTITPESKLHEDLRALVKKGQDAAVYWETLAKASASESDAREFEGKAWAIKQFLVLLQACLIENEIGGFTPTPY